MRNVAGFNAVQNNTSLKLLVFCHECLISFNAVQNNTSLKRQRTSEMQI